MASATESDTAKYMEPVITATRFHHFELHDHDWFPRFLRDDLTDMLSHNWTVKPPIVPWFYIVPADIVLPKLLKALRQTASKKIIDLCSGGGGPWPSLSQSTALKNVDVVLTDLYPNIDAFERAVALSKQRLSFSRLPIDATKCSMDGFRTMFASMHHLEPDVLRIILQDCVQRKQGFASFEQTWRSWSFLIGMFVVHITLLAPIVFALCVKPFRARKLFLLPLEAFVSFHDGVVSALRTYSRDEFLTLTREADPYGTFHWTVEQEFVMGHFLPITTYVGIPNECCNAGEEQSKKKM